MPSVVPNRQLDQGTYEVHGVGSSTPPPLVGYCYVEGTGDYRVEHWALYPSFASPSGSNQMNVRATTGTNFSSLTAFVSAMKGLESTVGTIKYVRATCEYFATLP